MEVIKQRWFNGVPGGPTIGIVLTKNQQDKYRAFIGTANGENKNADIKFIADWGSAILPTHAKAVFPNIDINKDNYKI